MTPQVPYINSSPRPPPHPPPENFSSHSSTANVSPHKLSNAPAIDRITPLKYKAWEALLAKHPDREEVQWCLDGIREGFRVGYTGPRNSARLADNHGITELSEMEFVDGEMAKQVQLGRRLGPFDAPPFSNFMVSPLSIAYKKHSQKMRLVHDYSFPKYGNFSTSVNSFIPDEAREVDMTNFDSAIELLLKLHERDDKAKLWMYKLDVESAFRLLPVHPDDYHLMGMVWRNKYYVDLVVGFGIGSSCNIWERVAKLAEWIVRYHYKVECLIHYVDDFFGVSASSKLSAAQLQAVRSAFRLLGIPISEDKTVGPIEIITFLGIEIDSVTRTVRLDEARLARVQSELAQWIGRSTASINELQSIAGLLCFCSRAIRPGRTFCRRIFNYIAYLSKKESNVNKPLRLSHSVLADLQWWNANIGKFNGKMSYMPFSKATLPVAVNDSFYIATDACSSGWGAVFGPHWICGEFTEEQNRAAMRNERDSMPYKEMLAVVIAASTWAHMWREKQIYIHTDCEDVMFALNKGDSKNPPLMHLIRVLTYIAIEYHFDYKLIHIAGATNIAPDLLSRSEIQQFIERCQNRHPNFCHFAPSMYSPIVQVPNINW